MNSRRAWAYLAMALLLAPAAAAQTTTPPCIDAAISNSNDGWIALRNGLKYTVFPGTEGRIMTWLPGDKVTVCPLGGNAYLITNTSRKGANVKALRKN